MENKQRILIADDEKDIRAISAAVLGSKGYDTISVEDGQKAWKTYQKQKGELSLLLTDFNMPGINGDELTKRVKQDNPNFPVVLYTGLKGNMELARQAGVDYVLEKPFNNSVLVETVRKALDGKQE